LKKRRVRFTKTAQRHVDREHAWWLENRDNPETFVSELEDAFRVLALLPGIGTAYTNAGVIGLRRLYVRKLTSHRYYTFDDDEVIVRALWGARRGRGPTLKP
jgi:plasmid stabilization system protein ParE